MKTKYILLTIILILGAFLISRKLMMDKQMADSNARAYYRYVRYGFVEKKWVTKYRISPFHHLKIS